ncbi:hypothetical protein IJ707_06585, partial [bacterium]|nr:hypothetical protein [bacterium]
TSISIESDTNFIGVDVDLDGPNKGKHQLGTDHFYFSVDEDKKENGFIPYSQDNVAACIGSKGANCTAWVSEFDNMDYLKADNSGKCNNNTSRVLDGVSNITCK